MHRRYDVIVVNRTQRVLFLLLIAVNLFLASWFVLHGDIYFTADIARDFHLLDELHEKKIMLIGPRSSGELYHGPLWAYLNYPAYLLGNGDPVVVGWYWVLLALAGIAVNYSIAKRLFNTTVAVAYSLMVSLYVTFHTRAFSHPHAAMFTIPVWFFCFIRYVETKRIRYLAAHVLLSAAIVQFELAPGVPLTLLSIAVLGVIILKRKTYRHIAVLLLLPLALGNFIVFDFRHDHLLWKKLLSFVTPYTDQGLFDFTLFIQNRVHLFFTSTEILRRDPGGRNIVLFVILLFLAIRQIISNTYRIISLSFLYFYTGYFVLSFINKGPILYYHLYPFFLLVFLIFSSFLASNKKFFAVLFAGIYIANLHSSIGDVRDAEGFIGKSKVSWKFLSSVAREVYGGPEKEFGYFVYSPDILAYEPKYAMKYMGKLFPEKTAFYFQKKSVTYLVTAPHPPGNPYMLDEWWRKNQVRLATQPIDVIRFDNGYKIEKHLLSQKDQQVYFDPAIDPGLHFR